MTASTTAADNQLLASVQAILDGLKKTADGAVLHGFIERGLRKFGATRIEAAFLAFVDKLLVRYLDNPDSDPATRIKVKVIQQRLRPYLAEIPARPVPAVPTASAPPAPTPAAPAAPPVAKLVSKPATAGQGVRRAGETANGPSLARGPRTRVPDVPPITSPIGESLPEQLAHQMADALTRSHDFDALLQTSLLTLDQSGDTPDVAELKRLLKSGIEELISEHRTLEKNLTDTRRGLQVMAEDRRQMEKALDHARKNSLTDELTGLPNRSAFLRQLDSEIGRARRYGFSLALALIDLDDLKTINERHGYAAGDAILHAYAREIMSQFRGYDLVARYGDDEFAVLLPNTQRDGATRAIDKAQKHAAGTFIQFNGQNLPLPSFSSVLTLYSHGEQPDALLKRADEALSHAKLRGRAQSVVALAAN
ncbi:MAG TPA: GGDEF domain-containing protein [Acidiferrobacterales bacterium]|nr:GGDEF domain-containing protein [Acidiferrobacterales bacterium]